MSARTSDLEQELKRLNTRAISRADRASRGAYVAEVYRAARANAKDLSRQGDLRRRRDIVVEQIDLIMQRTSGDDRRLRSKHGSALKYAAVKKVASQDVLQFLTEQGGYNACATEFGIWVRRQKAEA
jgi:hypothetical protein